MMIFSTDPAELEAEIRSIPITLEPLPSPREGQLSPEDQALVSRLFFETQDGSVRSIRTLKRLVAKYPKVPSLKNHLTVALVAAGLHRQADKVNDQLLRENPDYLFGILNHASQIIERQSDIGRIPEILVKPCGLSI